MNTKKRWRGPFTFAFKAGQEARKKGTARQQCPYADKRDSYRKSVTYSRAWRRAWFDGWETIDHGLI